MRVIQKSIETRVGVNAEIWFTKEVRFDLDRDQATLSFQGYVNAQAIQENKNPLDIQIVTVYNIQNMPKTFEAGVANVYEAVFEQLLVKVLATELFAGGTISEVI